MEVRREENHQKVMLTKVSNGEVKVALMSKGTRGENGLHFELSSHFSPNNNGGMLLKDGHLKSGSVFSNFRHTRSSKLGPVEFES